MISLSISEKGFWKLHVTQSNCSDNDEDDEDRILIIDYTFTLQSDWFFDQADWSTATLLQRSAKRLNNFLHPWRQGCKLRLLRWLLQ